MAKTKEGEAAKKAAAEAAAKPPDEPPPPPLTPTEQLRANTELLEKALDAEILAEYVRGALPAALPAALPSRSTLLAHLSKAEEDMEMDAPAPSGAAAENGTAPVGLLPEVEAYAFLLVVTFLVDRKRYAEAKEVATAALKRLGEYNRRTLDGLAARIYFYFSWTHECTGTLSEIRSLLLALHRTAVLRHDEYGQETLLNLLLRNYLHYNLYDQAEKLRSKAQRPEMARSTPQLCRYLLYLGRIRAIQLEYTDAKDCLQQAARKAPAGALGFRLAVAKWLALVRLLLGEVPEYGELTAQGLAAPLAPYLALAQAVRSGDLTAFQHVAETHGGTFAADKTGNLVARLRHNVICAGLRRINLAYSRISLQDVAAKLGLASVEDTECIVAKAIRDGGIEATLDHAARTMSSRETADVYATPEPAAAFHARVAFCLDIHNEAVRAMRFEAGANKKELETAESARQRAIDEEELAKELEEEDGVL
ncbi:hypothetical protein WJX81_005784 [Elliptochloris bilobata]|uniref:PCI domain-containing protein n=1 Tax=Elliptochloris bilobata TaxID=381761 RepID=A0AAW1SJC9_9CHLO